MWQVILILTAFLPALYVASLFHPTLGTFAATLVAVLLASYFKGEQSLPLILGILGGVFGVVSVLYQVWTSNAAAQRWHLIKSSLKALLIASPVLYFLFAAFYETPRLLSHAYWEGCQFDLGIAGTVSLPGLYQLPLVVDNDRFESFLESEELGLIEFQRTVDGTGWYLVSRSVEAENLAESALIADEGEEFFWPLNLRLCGSHSGSSNNRHENTLSTVEALTRFVFEELETNGRNRITQTAGNVENNAESVLLALFGPDEADRVHCRLHDDENHESCLLARDGVLPAMLPQSLQPPRCRGWLRSPSNCLMRRILKPVNAGYERDRDAFEASLRAESVEFIRGTEGAEKALISRLSEFIVDYEEAAVNEGKFWTLTAFGISTSLGVYATIWVFLTGAKLVLIYTARLYFKDTESEGFVLAGKTRGGSQASERVSVERVGANGRMRLNLADLDWSAYGSGVSFTENGIVGLRRTFEVALHKMRMPNRYITHRFSKDIGSIEISTDYATDFAIITLKKTARCMVSLDNVVAFSSGVKFEVMRNFKLSAFVTGEMSHVVATRSATASEKEFAVVCARRTLAKVFNKDNFDQSGFPGIIALDTNMPISVRCASSWPQVYFTRTLFVPSTNTAAVLAHDSGRQRSFLGNVSKGITSILVPF